MRSLGKVGISFNPVKAVHVRCESSGKFTLNIVENSYLILHLDFVNIGACLDKGPVEIVTIISSEDGWLGFNDVGKKFD